jgi:CRP/FNR family transcriptional regulator, cyclic AMP receptor protein
MNKQGFSKKTKVLAAATLAQKIGHLKTEHFPENFFDNIPTQTFNAHKVVRPKEELFIVQQGIVEIWHTREDMLVTKLQAGTLFGDLPLLGQTMYGTQAMSGGVTLGVMNFELVTNRITESPIKVLEVIGPRLIRVEIEHYRVAFQSVTSRIAALLLDLAGATSTVQYLTQEEIGNVLGVYRETITMSMRSMKENKLIEIGRKRITLLDKKALRELSEL